MVDHDEITQIVHRTAPFNHPCRLKVKHVVFYGFLRIFYHYYYADGDRAAVDSDV
jgi:hypothetical protein